MYKWIIGCALLAITGSAFAAVSCDDLKQEIDAKIQSQGVSNYLLEVIPNKDVMSRDGKIIGSCDGGSKKIIYLRNGNNSSSEVSDN